MTKGQMRAGLSPEVKSYTAARGQCLQVGACLPPVLWLGPCPRVLSRLWTRLGEEGVLGSPTTWHGLLGAPWTISVLSEDDGPCVWNATLTMTFLQSSTDVKQFASGNTDKFLNRELALTSACLCCVMRKYIVYSLKLPIPKGSF